MAVLPVFSYAANPNSLTSSNTGTGVFSDKHQADHGYFTNSLRAIAGSITKYLFTILYGFAFLALIIGLIRYVIVGAADDEKRAKGKSMMIWSVIGIFIMVSLFGIIKLLSEIFNVETQNSSTIVQYK